ncbi:hypothetical protein KKC88_02885 [Patescibacteria group bacterium]|nr:hypothetical protein [Patescibacteria group bacterium]MBU1673817.1 hypothetical protein [Patescibacteria group bacterium]MBU1964064.1 hypothetical protein [Patescibacteria group bacterium]
MKKLLVLVIVAGFFCTVIPASAIAVTSDYFGAATFFRGPWSPTEWEYFGGCSIDKCVEPYLRSNQFVIGEKGVKQGVYSVKGPSPDPARGKFVFKYSYFFHSKEKKSSTADKGIIKVKNVDTDKVLYYKEVFPKDKGEWKDIRFVLSTSHVKDKLQWVFEVENDDAKVSTMDVSYVIAKHRDKPRITGKIYRWNNGVKEGIAGASVLLKPRYKNKALKTTKSDQDGNFDFFPVKKMRRYKIIAKYQGVRKKAFFGKAKMGITRDKQIEFP